ncbi:gamma-glutamyltransferase family protein [Nocardioides sp. LMS-CY]|uniref:gamma-glutamyltransferase family protein n=1 Tax=Nocardioides sp. (strain LMS-CY) TaxID=2840457 RepID=UPI001C000202|nr:gamma-glutamyltransferase [Nocardioides sp. LMS-CY]QWF20990.1 gamma-glutamyltransferase family protein [Nocardioides sp. LMS-CY]
MIFRAGGNAIDAGVAAGIALTVIEPHMCTFAGVAPIMVRPARTAEPVVIDGVGSWPAGISPEHIAQWFGDDIPIGVQRSVVPGAPGAWLTALRDYGTLSVHDVLEPAIELCRTGVPVSPGLASFCGFFMDRMRLWPTTMEVFAPGGVPLAAGELLRQPDLASTFVDLVDAEAAARGAGMSREASIDAARGEFYEGRIARDMLALLKTFDWPMTAADFAGHCTRVERPVQTLYRGHSIFACGPWSQGPLLPMVLNVLEGYDLSPDAMTEEQYLHVFLEAFKLAGADREAYFGDPRAVEVPMAGLLSKEYAARRRSLIAETAAPELPAPGIPLPGALAARGGAGSPPPAAGNRPPDTSHVCAMDAEGNMFSALPSDHVFGSPMVAGRGFVVSHRGGQFWLDPSHPGRLAPGKRPRITPNPAMVMRGNRAVLAFGSPGEDLQCQAMAQFVNSLLDRGLGLQSAVEAPRVASHALPSSFFPHAHAAPRAVLEVRDNHEVLAGLRARGHDVAGLPAYSYGTGAVGAVRATEHGHIEAAADPRRPDAFAWAR